MKTIVAIPVFNESKLIGGIVSGIKKMGFDTLVIDDGSDDASGIIAEKNGAIVLKNEKNYGKGYSIRKAIQFARSFEYGALILMDGDGQHNTGEIKNFLSSDLEKYDLVVGSRMHDTKNMPIVRFLTNKLMSKLISVICRQNVEDSQSGFRLLRRNLFENLELNSDRFEIESEILLRTAKSGFKIGNIPVSTVYAGENSKIRPIQDTIRFFCFLLKFLLA